MSINDFIPKYLANIVLKIEHLIIGNLRCFISCIIKAKLRLKISSSYMKNENEFNLNENAQRTISYNQLIGFKMKAVHILLYTITVITPMKIV